MLIDTHCHLSVDDLNFEKIVNNMNGIIITSGYDKKSNLEVIELVNKYSNIYGTIGIHPENIDDYNEENLKFIEENLNNPKIVGIGEIGLDYYYTKENIDFQKQSFVQQLKLAERYNKPIVVHSRDSIQDVYDILKKFKLKGSIHCFSSSLEMAKEFIKLGYKIGIGGIVTFKNSKKLQEIVKAIDISNILLETDSPYLSPEPYRGQKNTPLNVRLVAKKISEIKDIPEDYVIEATFNNAKNEFDLKI